jgi:hypothetical protein
VYLVPDGVCVAVIVAPANGCPAASVTAPVKLLVVTCAYITKDEISIKTNKVKIFIFSECFVSFAKEKEIYCNLLNKMLTASGQQRNE